MPILPPRILPKPLLLITCRASPPVANLGATPDLRRIHHLGIGDKVKISVFGETELSGQYEIGATGILSLPLIGETH